MMQDECVKLCPEMPEFHVLFFIMEPSDTLGVPTSCNILRAHYGAVLSAAHEANEIQLFYSVRQRRWLSASVQLHPKNLQSS
jgi:hypothetical protein